MRSLLRWLDVRGDEARPLVAFFLGLLAIVVAHTVLETARDTLFLTHLGPGALGGMYVVAAGLTFAVGTGSAKLTHKLGARRALLASQGLAALLVLAFFFLPPTRGVLISLYGVSAVTGALLVPQLWAAVATTFHAAQSRRLFGLVAVAGILGAVFGSAAAAATLMALETRWLLLLSAVAFLASAVATSAATSAAPRTRAMRAIAPPGRPARWFTAFREEPILRRIALAVALGAATTLLVDYAFKAALSERVPAAQLGPFLARYGLVMNGLALVTQLLLARRILARAGVIAAAGVAPSLLLIGSALTVLTGGSLLAILGAKVADAATRHSVHRTSSELIYLAVPAGPRNRAKPIIDGAVARSAQAVAGGLVLLLASVGLGSVKVVALLAAVLAIAWSGATYSLWKPYLALFRRSLLGPTADPQRSTQQLDLASVDLLVEALGSSRPAEVIGAMGALARRGRVGIIPALMLLHENEDVLAEALELLAPTKRRDWVRFAERLVDDRRWRVRRAALRALARARLLGRGDKGVAVAADEHPWTRGYLTVATPVRSTSEGSPERRTSVLALLDADLGGRDALLGVLTALGDAEPSDEAELLLVEVALRSGAHHDDEVQEALARAARSLAATRLLPWLVARLEHREARSAIRGALVSMGAPAYTAVEAALLDPATPRRVRIHLPRTLEQFESQAAADVLFERLTDDPDGFVRYKCLRALGHLVESGCATLPLLPLRALARRELTEHFRVLGLGAGLAAPASRGGAAAQASQALLLRLLDEKARQSLARVYLLIGLGFPEEDLQRVHEAATGGDVAARSSAAEFLDALLAPPRRRRPDDGLRALLRLATEDLPVEERLARYAAETGTPREAGGEATLRLLLQDRDVTVASFAAALVVASGTPTGAALAGTRDPRLVDAVRHLLGDEPTLEPAHG